MKIFKNRKKEDVRSDLQRSIAEIEKRLSDKDCKSEEKKELLALHSHATDALAKLESSKSDFWAKVAAGLLAAIAAIVPTVLTILNYNRQYAREREFDDTQLGMERSKFSAGNNIKKH